MSGIGTERRGAKSSSIARTSPRARTVPVRTSSTWCTIATDLGATSWIQEICRSTMPGVTGATIVSFCSTAMRPWRCSLRYAPVTPAKAQAWAPPSLKPLMNS